MHPLFHPLFVDYCAYFNGNDDYFECHEVLEEYWKEIAPSQKLHPLVGYVQLATGMYHWRRGNFSGAKRMLGKAISNFEHNRESEFFDFVDLEELHPTMKLHLQKIEANTPFTRFSLPIENGKLLKSVEDKIKLLPPLDPHFIFNKHMLRDRSEILEAREFKKRSRL
ncbi:DUF309 domain-containing protein [Solibacillus silvestris]|uniref:DUF309 domain-containing protein n=1 Tax=Solibacillus silvestris TaxID=76853 RepID=UPI003F7EE983